MNADIEKLTFRVDGENFGNFKLRETEERMKLYIKLNKDETAQWKALKTALTGDTKRDDLLARILFFKGIHTITDELNERVENMSEDEKKAVMEQVSEEQVAAASKIAEQELGAGEEDEITETPDN